jgi:hypothetical protein
MGQLSYLVIIDDLNVIRITVTPAKGHSPLIVDPYAVESLQIPFQALKPVPGRHSKICQIRRLMQIKQFTARNSSKLIRKRAGCPCSLVVKQILGESIPERLYHIPILSELDNLINA